MKESSLVLVTGGAGFIGGHLSQLLIAQGHRVRILDPLTAQVHGDVPLSSNLSWLGANNIEFIRDSVCSKKTLEKAIEGVDFIVHLAAETGTGQSMYEIEKYYEVNCQGTALLFDVLANTKKPSVKRVVLASSRSVYGEGAYVCDDCSDSRVTPEPRTASELKSEKWDPVCPRCDAKLSMAATKENDAIRPASIYASSKYAQEDIVRIGCSAANIGHYILRLQNVYGEGQSLNNPYTGILSIFSTRLRRNLSLPIFEDGLESRDFVHVDDVVNTVIKSLFTTDCASGVFNVGSGIATSIMEVALILSEKLGKKSDIEVTGQYRVGDIRHNRADISRLKNVLGYLPKVSLDEGMGRFAKWVLTQPIPEDKLKKTYLELQARNLMG